MSEKDVIDEVISNAKDWMNTMVEVLDPIVDTLTELLASSLTFKKALDEINVKSK